jgi:excinuclease ABC subunit C
MEEILRETFLRRRIAELPKAPGVYLFKDSLGRVLYVGKSIDLRSRVSSYFQPSADLVNTRGPRIVEMVKQVFTIDFIECENEVEALLDEARLIKDIQPPYNERLIDGKSFPYIEITMQDDFPKVRITREPNPKSKLFGPFVSPGGLAAAMEQMQRIFKFCTCSQEIKADDPKLRFNRPCLMYSIKRCSGPCAGLISQEAYREDIKRLIKFLSGKRVNLLRQMQQEMEQASKDLNFEKAARLRDQIKAMQSLSLSGDPERHLQPEVFFEDPRAGLEKLAKILNMSEPPRVIEGFDMANLQGQEACGSMVQFIDGISFKGGYKRFKIKYTENKSDDYAMMREVLCRRYRHIVTGEELMPELILIDGGPGQLHAAQDAFAALEITPPKLISLAKREELIFTGGPNDPIKLQRNDPALKLLQRIRDEAHRFAQYYHHILRRKKVMGE